MKARNGIALPIVLGVVLCFGFWIGSLSYTMSQSRTRFQQMIKLRRAYFLARSALQHFFLKVKIYQRRHPKTINALYKSTGDEWQIISKSFIEDIVMPYDSGASYTGKYGIASFSIDSFSDSSPYVAVKISAFGNVDNVGEIIFRTYKVSR